MRSVLEAVATVLSAVRPTSVEDVALAEAAGRVLAADVIAARPLPGFDNSAMDGYAARAAELPAKLPVIGVSAAGGVFAGKAPPASCVRIFTGAPMPSGCDCVVLQEDAKRDGEQVELPSAERGENVRVAGEDIAVGERAVAAGTRLGSGELGLLAALGVATVQVHRRPRVAVLATGDELVDVEVVPKAGQIVDSSRYALCEAVRALGGEAVYLGIVPDDQAASEQAIKAALGFDVVITTGGVSVGDRDFVKAAFEGAGVSLEMWKVAMKPGKPLAFGLGGGGGASSAGGLGGDAARGSGQRTLVFGLPGNPVSSTVSFELFVRPALLALQGVTAARAMRPRAPVILKSAYRKQAGRAHYLRAVVEREGATLVATPHPKQGSAMLTSLVGINALLEIAADATEVPAGGEVTAILLDAV